MLEREKIQLLGSDCHNMRNRMPNMGKALQIIGERGCGMIERNCKALGILPGEV